MNQPAPHPPTLPANQLTSIPPPSAIEAGAPPPFPASPSSSTTTPAPNPAASAANVPPPSPGLTAPPSKSDLSPQPLDPDSPSVTKPQDTLYTVPLSQVIFRNFLAGFSRTLGGLILYLVFIAVIGYISFTFIMPQLQPLLDTFSSISKLQQPSTAFGP